MSLIRRGDLVACYITNTNEWESLMSWGLVLETNDSVNDILVLDNSGNARWWPSHRWKIISTKTAKKLDKRIKLA